MRTVPLIRVSAALATAVGAAAAIELSNPSEAFAHGRQHHNKRDRTYNYRASMADTAASTTSRTGKCETFFYHKGGKCVDARDKAPAKK